MGRPKKTHREKDLTSRYLSGRVDEDAIEQRQGFTKRSKHHTQRKMEQTALLRAAEEALSGDIESLPAGQVLQVYSLFYDVLPDGDDGLRLCVLRKTLSKLLETPIVVGDRVRFRETGSIDEQGRPEAVIEQLQARRSVLTRSDSFKAMEQHPIVANADQMLVVAAFREPDVRWGLVDRMLIAAQAGKLEPVICLNKVDLARDRGDSEYDVAKQVLDHYRSLGVRTIETSAERGVGLEELRGLLGGKTTVLAGHSGVGKSSLLNAVDPKLDLRTGAISGYTGKGRHTTTFARRYPIDVPGESPSFVIDTPGVKMFGLWGVTRENLDAFFPDVEAGTAPEWRRESYQRILESLPEPTPGEEQAQGNRY